MRHTMASRAAAGLAAIALIASACGGDEGSGNDAGATADNDGLINQEAAVTDGGETTNGGAEISMDALVAAAEEEGELTWYSSTPEAVLENVASGFESEYDVDVTYIRLVDGPLAQRFASEQQAGASEADFVNVAQQAFFTAAIPEGWFATIDEGSVPSLAGWPENAFFEGTYALLNVQPLGFAYNTDAVDVPLEDWEDLLNPSFAGRTLLGDPVPAFLALYDHWRNEYGDEYLESLAGNNLTVVDSIVPGTQSLAAGEASLTIPAMASVVQPLIDSGAPVKLVIPANTTGVEQYGAIVDNAPNPNAARLFMNYLLSVAGQEQLTAGLAASVLPDVPGAMELPANYARPDEAGALNRESETNALLGM